MCESLISVGLDVGTTSTQLVVSELQVQNRAGAFAVPDMEITQRRIRYESPVYFTPLLSESLVDSAALARLVAAEYERAGLRREQVDTGAIIITGETSRRENARSVLRELTGYAGEFVVATAGPHLESVLAARGAGAVQLSRQTARPVLHMDIGGGTSNLAWLRDGKLVATGCLNVGGRLLKLTPEGVITYISPVVQPLFSGAVGQKAEPGQLEALADTLAQALEMAAGLREKSPLLPQLTTREAGPLPEVAAEAPVLSFSGGVADCIDTPRESFAFGDIGPILGRAIRRSRLCAGAYHLGEQTIRATVIGAGCHSAQLSGSTVFHRGVRFPMKDLAAVALTPAQQESPQAIRQALAKQDGPAVLALPGYAAPTYPQVRALARAIAEGMPGPIAVCLQQDMAKALGQALAAAAGESRPILCIDRVKLTQDSFLDVGAPVGPALPVVVKTLVLQ